ncbi:hypothetical protein Btru_009296 [Bulinus truncatus]|nr:hypothetical protein Btru_009296 [Bulinus truncatus]
MTRNDQVIYNEDRCAIHKELSSTYTIFVMSSTMCDRTVQKIDIIFFPHPERVQNETNEEYQENEPVCTDLCKSVLICTAEIILALCIVNFPKIRSFFQKCKKKYCSNQLLRVESRPVLQPGTDGYKYRIACDKEPEKDITVHVHKDGLSC